MLRKTANICDRFFTFVLNDLRIIVVCNLLSSSTFYIFVNLQEPAGLWLVRRDKSTELSSLLIIIEFVALSFSFSSISY